MTRPSPAADPATTSGPIRGAAWLAAAGWAVFVATLATVAVIDPPTNVDHALQADLAAVGPAVLRHAAWLRTLSAFTARLGSAPLGVAAIAVIGIAYATRRRTLTPALFLTAAYAGAIATVAATKRLLHRPEPYDRIGDLGRSFPSGHSATAVVVWGGLALLITFWSRRSTRSRTAGAGALVVVAVVAVTMLVRSAHWISDIVAGLAVGAAWLGTAGLLALHYDRTWEPTPQETIQ